LEGWEIPKVPPDIEFRRNLEKKASEVGTEELYLELMKVDPVAAERIDRRNVRRVIRALEVQRFNKKLPPRLQFEKTPPFKTLLIGLTTARSEIYRRVDLRVDNMIEQGLVDEVRKLVDMGYDLDLPAMSGIGYKQIGMFLKGELNLAEAIQKTKYETHRFVRHQYNWFRLKDDRILWFDIQEGINSEITAFVAEFIAGE